MTRYEWRTIREAEMNEMRQRQIRLGKRRQQGRNEAFKGIAQLLLSAVIVAIAQLTDVADTGLILLAILFTISGICSTINGTKRWIK